MGVLVFLIVLGCAIVATGAFFIIRGMRDIAGYERRRIVGLRTAIWLSLTALMLFLFIFVNDNTVRPFALCSLVLLLVIGAGVFVYKFIRGI
jgi:hypothetical protein